jgi:hypothetical protein
MSMFVLRACTDPSAKAQLMTPVWKLAKARLHGPAPPTQVGQVFTQSS